MAIDFPGTDEYLQLGNVFAPGTGNFTLAAWVKSDQVTAEATVFSDENHVGDPNLGLVRLELHGHEAGDYFALVTRETDGTDLTNSYSTTSCVAGTWYHVAAVRSGTTQYLYINGVQEDSDTCTAGSMANDKNSVIGAFAHDFTKPWDGLMEDLRYFSRALSADEIKILAAGYRGPLGGEVGWWLCDAAKGITHWDGATLAAANTVRDESGNGNTATPSGDPLGAASEAPRVPTWTPHALYTLGISYFKSDLAGTVTPAGVLARLTGKAIAGTMTPAGAVNKWIDTLGHAFAGTVTPAGALAKTAGKALAGTVTPVGVIARAIAKKMLAGTVTPVGVLTPGLLRAFWMTLRTRTKFFTATKTDSEPRD